MPYIRIDTAVFEHVGMNHPRAKHFNPAAAFADVAPFALAEHALHVYFHTGFRKREERRTEADFGLVAKQPFHKSGQVCFEVRHTDVFIHV